MKTRTKLFLILWVSAIVSTILILPYVFNVESEVLKKAALTLPLLVLISMLQGGVTFGIAAFIGLYLAEKTGFGLPLLSSWIEHKEIRYRGVFRLSAMLGLAAGAMILIIDKFVFRQFVAIKVPLWQGFLACFYGGIAEEILMRLFLMSLFVFALMSISKKKEASSFIVWSSILVVSVLFGLGHLPITSAVVSITPWVIFRAILLNGIGGVVFGWLYWKKGLESAIISHYFADIILQVIGPSL
jgi:membrane protease YdiL (CAAX protease family)